VPQRTAALLGQTDALTGLANHRGFHELLMDELARAQKEDTSLALVSIDIDGFEAINDTHGYGYGDEVLAAVGEKLRAALRDSDHAARIGGDEFALILPHTDAEHGYRIAELARATAETIALTDVTFACSAGVAAFPEDADDGQNLCQLADAALAWAKREGKRQTRRFDPDHVSVVWTEGQLAEVEALLAGPVPVEPHFQPVVALAMGRVIGYEAIARFPGSSERSTDTWLKQAWGCGLGPDLEATIIRAALEPTGQPIDTRLFVPVSSAALSSSPVAEVLPEDLSGLVIQIAESEFNPGRESLTAAIRDMKERGALIAIADVGAGHAGLNRVMEMQPDVVKLNPEISEGIHADPARMALVESLARFAARVGTTVCADGIASLDDLSTLADLDVEWGSGDVLAPAGKPWAAPSNVATSVCRTALANALSGAETGDGSLTAGDRGLERLSAGLAAVRSIRDLENVISMIASELHASQVTLSKVDMDAGVIHTLAETHPDPGARQFPMDEYPLSAKVLNEGEVVQVMVGDPESDPSEVELLLEYGRRCLLMVPVVTAGESIGLVEAYSDEERPWTRGEISRARIVSNLFATAIAGVEAGEGSADEGLLEQEDVQRDDQAGERAGQDR
jgi:diguanylate cyclase (GGDEF)-like protein